MTQLLVRLAPTDKMSNHLTEGCCPIHTLGTRHGDVATTMNVYGNASLRATQQANSKVVQMVMKQESTEAS
jgi:hypothetical protein